MSDTVYQAVIPAIVGVLAGVELVRSYLRRWVSVQWRERGWFQDSMESYYWREKHPLRYWMVMTLTAAVCVGCLVWSVMLAVG